MQYHFVFGWILLFFYIILIMLSHQSTSPVILGRYSSSYFLQIILSCFIFIIGILGFIAVQRKWLSKLEGQTRFHYLICIISVIFALVFNILVWFFYPGSRIVAGTMYFMIYLSLISWLVCWLVLHQTRLMTRSIPYSFSWIILGLVFAYAIVFAISYVGRVPAPMFLDEPFLNSQSIGWLTTGRPYVEMMPQRPSNFILHLVTIHFYYLQSHWIQLFGFTLESTRWFHLLFLWLISPVVYLFLRKRMGKIEASIASLFVLMVAIDHNIIRPDVLVSLIVALGLFFYFRYQQMQSSFKHHFFLGLLFCFIIEGHPLGIRFGLVIGIFYTWDLIQARNWLYKPFWGYLLGGITFSMFYVLIRMYWMEIDITAFVNSINTAYGIEISLKSTDDSYWSRLMDWAPRWIRDYASFHPAEFLMLILGLYTSFVVFRRSGQSELKRIYIFFGLSTLSILFISPGYGSYYWMHHLALLSIVGVAYVHYHLQQANTRLTLGTVGLIAVVLPMIMGHQSNQIRNNGVRDLINIGYAINERLPDDVQAITAYQPYYYGLAFRDYISTEAFGANPVSKVIEWGRAKPQVVVLTRGWDSHYEYLQDYIADEGMILATCYSIRIFGGWVDLYTTPDIADRAGFSACER